MNLKLHLKPPLCWAERGTAGNAAALQRKKKSLQGMMPGLQPLHGETTTLTARACSGSCCQLTTASSCCSIPALGNGAASDAPSHAARSAVPGRKQGQRAPRFPFSGHKQEELQLRMSPFKAAPCVSQFIFKFLQEEGNIWEVT